MGQSRYSKVAHAADIAAMARQMCDYNRQYLSIFGHDAHLSAARRADAGEPARQARHLAQRQRELLRERLPDGMAATTDA